MTAYLIRVFYSEEELPICSFCQQVAEEGCPKSSYVHISGWRWGKSRPCGIIWKLSISTGFLRCVSLRLSVLILF